MHDFYVGLSHSYNLHLQFASYLHFTLSLLNILLNSSEIDEMSETDVRALVHIAASVSCILLHK